MAKANKQKMERAPRENGTLLFEKQGDDFTIPRRTRSGMYDETLEALKETEGVVLIFKDVNARPVNTRRKSLITAAEGKGMWVHAAVRAIDDGNGGKTNALLAQYKGDLADAPAKAARKPRSKKSE